MAQQDEKIFADGFSFKRSEKAPDFVIGRMSMKADEAVAFIRKYEKGGWVNVQVKTARSGNYYVELDTYEAPQNGMKPQGQQEAKPVGKSTPKSQNEPSVQDEAEDGEELPF